MSVNPLSDHVVLERGERVTSLANAGLMFAFVDNSISAHARFHRSVGLLALLRLLLVLSRLRVGTNEGDIVVIEDIDRRLLRSSQRPGAELRDTAVHVLRRPRETEGGSDVAEIVPDLQLNIRGLVSRCLLGDFFCCLIVRRRRQVCFWLSRLVCKVNLLIAEKLTATSLDKQRWESTK